MLFRQKYRGKKTEFEFSETRLRHYYSDSDETIEFEVPYHGIDIDFPVIASQKNVIWKFTTIPFWFLTIFALGKMVMTAESALQMMAGLMVAGIWMSMIGMCYFLYKRGQVTLTMFDCTKGRLIVINEPQRQLIIDEIKQRVNSAHQRAQTESVFDNTDTLRSDTRLN